MSSSTYDCLGGLRWLLSLGLALSACSDMTGSLRPRAAFDMKCPQEQLKMTQLTPDCGPFECTMGVQGCNQQATYIYNHDTEAWVMNNTATPSVAQPAASAK